MFIQTMQLKKHRVKRKQLQGNNVLTSWSTMKLTENTPYYTDGSEGTYKIYSIPIERK